MLIKLVYDLELFVRVLVAMVCGLLIGYERESRLKIAGIRTHMIVCMASALMMLVSKYGFEDMLGRTGIGLDPSRIGAGIITAVGFLGGGVIFTRKLNISGITTAAGIWYTVGVGVALGSGMYVIGIASTFMLVAMQFLLGHKFRWQKTPIVEQVTIILEQTDDIKNVMEQCFSDQRIEVTNLKVKRLDKERLEVKMFVKFPDTFEVYDVMQLLKDSPYIQSIDI